MLLDFPINSNVMESENQQLTEQTLKIVKDTIEVQCVEHNEFSDKQDLQYV